MSRVMCSHRIGFHISIAGGLPKAVARAVERECTALQIFCGNPRAWTMVSRSPTETAEFRRLRVTAELSPLVVHACYLINACAQERAVQQRSIKRLAHEMGVAADLGAELYVLHPGSPRGKPQSWAVERCVRTLARAYHAAGRAPRVLLETTAGDYGPGGSFDALKGVIEGLALCATGLQTGLCVDSCHMFAAGYDFTCRGEADRLVSDIAGSVGLERLKLLHVNDSKQVAGSGIDRHAHIGQGHIGVEGLRHLLTHPSMIGLPMILETPWEGLELELSNIRVVRRLLSGAG